MILARLCGEPMHMLSNDYERFAIDLAHSGYTQRILYMRKTVRTFSFFFWYLIAGMLSAGIAWPVGMLVSDLFLGQIGIIPNMIISSVIAGFSGSIILLVLFRIIPELYLLYMRELVFCGILCAVIWSVAWSVAGISITKQLDLYIILSIAMGSILVGLLQWIIFSRSLSGSLSIILWSSFSGAGSVLFGLIIANYLWSFRESIVNKILFGLSIGVILALSMRQVVMEIEDARR